jgi:hypothetical protein
MADIVMLTQVIAKSNENKSNDPTPTPANDATKTVVEYKNQISVLGVLLGIFAAYLSWQCNTALGESTGMKVLYALFAYMFGGLYLLYYLLFRYDTCKMAVKQLSSGSSVPVGSAQFYYF